MLETTKAPAKKPLKDLNRKIEEAIALHLQLSALDPDTMTDDGRKELIAALGPLDEARLLLQNCLRYEGIK